MPATHPAAELYIGLMSGTSLDGIDAVVVNLSDGHCQLQHSTFIEIPNRVRDEILGLCTPGENEVERLGHLDHQLGELFATAVLALLKESQIPAEQIHAIGSHGQTIRHRPTTPHPFTLQIGSAAIIAQRTGITTASDFRSRDIAAGGQGAPLVPAFHAQQFDSLNERRCILNVGGIANITRLTGDSSEVVIGLDSGPGNLLMNGWCERHLGQPYDEAGKWGGSGKCHPELLASLLHEPYFQLPAPKSTGRELFNLPWLDNHLRALPNIAAEDVQATLLELTAVSIQRAIKAHASGCDALYVCGGGVHNQQLMLRLSELLAPMAVSSSQKIGLHPDWVEACAFAWLARQALLGLPGNLPEVTGASAPVVLGAIYPA